MEISKDQIARTTARVVKKNPLPKNAKVRILYPWSWEIQGQEMFLAPPTDKQSYNYDITCSIS